MRPSQEVIDLLMQYTHPNGIGQDLDFNRIRHYQLAKTAENLATAIERETGRTDAYIYVDPKEHLKYRTTPPMARTIYRSCTIGQERRPSWGTASTAINVAQWKLINNAFPYIRGCLTHTLPDRDIIRIFKARMTRTRFRNARLIAWTQAATTPDCSEYVFANPQNLTDIDEYGHMGLKGLKPWIFLDESETNVSEMPSNTTEPLTKEPQ